MDDITTNDQATLVDNQPIPDVVPVVAPPAEIIVEKVEEDVDDDDDEGEDYDDGGVQNDVPGDAEVSGDANDTGTTLPAAATGDMKGAGDLPIAFKHGFAIPDIVGTRILLSGFASTVKSRKELRIFAKEFKVML